MKSCDIDVKSCDIDNTSHVIAFIHRVHLSVYQQSLIYMYMLAIAGSKFYSRMGAIHMYTSSSLSLY